MSNVIVWPKGSSRPRGEFLDEFCKVQECSLEEGPADEDDRPRLWLGVDRISFVERLPEGEERSWSAPARMLLGRDHVGDLVPPLVRWLRTGSIVSRAKVDDVRTLSEPLIAQLERYLQREWGAPDPLSDRDRAALRRCLVAGVADWSRGG